MILVLAYRGCDVAVPLPSATKPKKGGSPYLHYLRSRVDALRNDPSMARDGAPGKLDVTKMTKTLASEWNEMSDSDKRVSRLGQAAIDRLPRHSCLLLNLFSPSYNKQMKPNVFQKQLYNDGENH